jgi:hypothetical protein
MDVEKQFFSASDDRDGGDPQVDMSKRWNAAVRRLAVELDDLPDGRNKSIAITHLEDVQMRGNRAIFEAGA